MIQPSPGGISVWLLKSAITVTLPTENPCQPMAPLAVARILQSLLGLYWHLISLFPARSSNWSCSISFGLMYYFYENFSLAISHGH
jgi:hypothetical protein